MSVWSRPAATGAWPSPSSPLSEDTDYLRLTLLRSKEPQSIHNVTLGDLLRSRHTYTTSATDLVVPGGLLIGRRAADPLPSLLNSRVLSRNHAQILVDTKGRVFVVDLKSMHGTRIEPSGGTTIALRPRQPVQILHGDVLVFGKCVDVKSERHQPVRARVSLRFDSAGPRDATRKYAALDSACFATSNDIAKVNTVINGPSTPATTKPVTIDLTQPVRRLSGYGLEQSALYESESEEVLPRGKTQSFSPIFVGSFSDAHEDDEDEEDDVLIIPATNRSGSHVLFDDNDGEHNQGGDGLSDDAEGDVIVSGTPPPTSLRTGQTPIEVSDNGGDELAIANEAGAEVTVVLDEEPVAEEQETKPASQPAARVPVSQLINGSSPEPEIEASSDSEEEDDVMPPTSLGVADASVAEDSDEHSDLNEEEGHDEEEEERDEEHSDISDHDHMDGSEEMYDWYLMDEDERTYMRRARYDSEDDVDEYDEDEEVEEDYDEEVDLDEDADEEVDLDEDADLEEEEEHEEDDEELPSADEEKEETMGIRLEDFGTRGQWAQLLESVARDRVDKSDFSCGHDLEASLVRAIAPPSPPLSADSNTEFAAPKPAEASPVPINDPSTSLPSPQTPRKRKIDHVDDEPSPTPAFAAAPAAGTVALVDVGTQVQAQDKVAPTATLPITIAAPATPAPTPAAAPEQPRPSKIRRIAKNVGLIALGAAIGSAGTIAGLLQLAE